MVNKNRIEAGAGIPSGLEIPRLGAVSYDDDVVMLVTRYLVAPQGQVQFDVEEWMRQRTKLFTSYTLPSIINQRRKPDAWILLISQWCDGYVDVLQEALDASGADFISIEYVETKHAGNNVEQYDRNGWQGLIGRRFSALRSAKPGATNVIVSRVDNDDALAHDYLAAVQTYAHHHKSVQHARLLSFPYGLQMCDADGRLVVHISPNGQFTSVVSPIDRPFLDIYQNHTRIFTENRMKQLPVELLATRRPMWIETVHGDNMFNKMHSYEEISVDTALLPMRFGFNVSAK